MRRTAAFAGGAMLCAIMTMISPRPAQAQSVWKYLGRIDFIASVYQYSIEGRTDAPPGTFDGTFTSISAGIGFNVPVYHLAHDLSLGINPNIEMAGVPGTAEEVDDRIPLTLSLEVPVYATLKYGTDASWHGESKIGFAAGIGAQYTALTTLDPADISTSYVAPGIMAEVNFRLGSSGLMKLRYSTILGTMRADVNGFDGEDAGDADIRQQAFHLIFNFNS